MFFFALADAIDVAFVKKSDNCITVFFLSKTAVANNHYEILYQSVLWRTYLFCLLVYLIKEIKDLELKQQNQFLILVWF